MKAPKALVSVILKVKASERLAAAKVAEKTYLSALKKLESFGDFSRETNEQMATEAAIAEVMYRFR